MKRLALFSVLVLFLCATAHAQNLRRNRGNRRQRRPGGKDGNGGGSQLFNALTVNYPLGIFDPAAPNWRNPAVYSSELDSISTKEREYLDFSRAQDQEDVWLYEHWFYGMKDGVIMESGALDGVLYSNSLMFESFANWTAIHVGKISPSGLRLHVCILILLSLFIFPWLRRGGS